MPAPLLAIAARAILADVAVSGALKVTARTNDQDIDRDTRDLIAETERICVEELNQSGYNIAYDAMLMTPHGDPQAIRASLESPAHNARGLRPGEKPPTVAQALINARRGRRGQKGLTGEPMRRAEERLIRMKMLGAFYHAAGWLEAQKVLARFGVKTKPVPPQIVDFGLPDGDAIPAKRGRTEVTVINLSRGADRVGLPAAQRALQTEAPEFEKRFLDRLEKLWNS